MEDRVLGRDRRARGIRAGACGRDLWEGSGGEEAGIFGSHLFWIISVALDKSLPHSFLHLLSQPVK